MTDDTPTRYDLCVAPLLKLLHWGGTSRQWREAMPHYSRLESLHALGEMMQRLNFEMYLLSRSPDFLEEQFLPCLFVGKTGDILIGTAQTPTGITVYDPVKREYARKKISELSGSVYSFRRMMQEKEIEKARWMRKTYLRNRPLIYSALGISFFLSILALLTPLFIVFVYNFVIKASSVNMLWQFSVGIIIALIGFSVLSRLRSQHLSLVGARWDRFIGDHIFERLLYLPPSYTESASVGSQVARLKDFTRLREFVTGQLMTLSFEIPFITVGITVIAILGGALVFIPITTLCIYILLGLLLYRESQRRLAEGSQKSAQQQEFLLEAINKLRAIKYTASLSTWEKRFREGAADVALANFRTTMLSGTYHAISDTLTVGTGMAVLGWGAVEIIHGTLSVGAMLAIMILSWRVLAPLKAVFNVYSRTLQMGNSLKQMTRLMRLNPESKPKEVSRIKPSELQGRITFNQVSLRYPDTYQPALLGITFDVKPGEWVGIVGRNGSGKTSILKLLLRTCQQQAGSVWVDNQDIRQFNEIEWRSLIAYLPQAPELFYGTVVDNIRFSDPTASDAAVEKAAEEAGILSTLRALPKGLQTHLRDFAKEKLSSSFQQGICLARVWIKKSPIILLDEPTTALDTEGDQRLLQRLQTYRGKTTILVVTHRPSYIKLMDKILVLDGGKLISQGTPEMVLPEILKEIA